MILFFFQTIQGETVNYEMTLDTSLDSAQYAVGGKVSIIFNTDGEQAEHLREKYGDLIQLQKRYNLNDETVVRYFADLNFFVKEVKHCLDQDPHYANSVMEIMVQIELVPATPLDEQVLLDLAAHRQKQRQAGV